MRRLALLVPLLSTTVLIACSDEAPPAQGGALGEVSDSIINGTPDTTHQAVVFVDMGNYACSGTIIAVNGNYAYVLTAARVIAWLLALSTFRTRLSFCSSSSFCLRSVMSRTILEAPMIQPSPSLIG